MEYAISSLDRFQGTNESSNVHDTNHPDEDRGTTVLGACISLTIGSIIAVVLRLWVIFIRGRKLGWDDATIIPALVRVELKSCFAFILTQP